MPTGSGKTVTFIEIAKDHFAETTQRVLMLVHRTELLQQAQKSLGERVFLISAGVKIYLQIMIIISVWWKP